MKWDDTAEVCTLSAVLDTPELVTALEEEDRGELWAGLDAVETEDGFKLDAMLVAEVLELGDAVDCVLEVFVTTLEAGVLDFEDSVGARLLVTTMVATEAVTVEVVLTVVVERVMERQEQAQEIMSEAKTVR